MDELCTSCKKKITNNVGTVNFLCPKCGKVKLVRCSNCRRNAVKYACYECGFRGPN
ncbi:DUF1610 domain-containing protein [archaeon]|nr:DUF1610 domain-containing protein [archaeon]